MSEQKALMVIEAGAPVALGSRAIPKPGQNEVVVKVSVAGGS